MNLSRKPGKPREWNWEPEENNLAVVKIQREIFQGDALSTLLFVIAKMTLNHIVRKCIGGYKLTKSPGNIYHPMYMDDIKLFGKNERELETLIQTLRIYIEDIKNGI